MSEYVAIAPSVKLGKDVKLSKFINLYGCEIGDEVKIGTFVEIQKGAKIGVRRGAREGVEDDTLVDAPGDCLLLDRLEAGECQPLARCKIALKDQFITGRRHPIDVAEQLVDADPGAVLRIIQPCCDPPAASQLRERGILVFTCALDIEDRVAGGTAPLARQF